MMSEFFTLLRDCEDADYLWVSKSRDVDGAGRNIIQTECRESPRSHCPISFQSQVVDTVCCDGHDVR
jgi:hypothetical protein